MQIKSQQIPKACFSGVPYDVRAKDKLSPKPVQIPVCTYKPSTINCLQSVSYSVNHKTGVSHVSLSELLRSRTIQCNTIIIIYYIAIRHNATIEYIMLQNLQPLFPAVGWYHGRRKWVLLYGSFFQCLEYVRLI